VILEQLKKLLATKEARKQELTTNADKSEDVVELRSINSELTSLNGEITELRGMIASAEQQESLNPVQTYVQNVATQARGADADPFDTLEYRQAFMKFAQTGAWEQRADAVTTVTDAAKVIPTTIMNEIIKELKVRGQLFARVRKLNVQGGVQFPILSLKPEASWITEASASERKKVQANTAVVFNYYGLECKVATSLIANITSLPMFEEVIRSLIVEAMMTALDSAIVVGDGSGKPLGITLDTRVASGQKVTLDQAEFSTWSAWKKKVFAKIPLAYRSGGLFIMAASTWEGQIDGMVDENKQPIARTNYNITDAIQERFSGKEVLLVEPDVVADYDAAAEGDVVAIYFKPSDYGINSNLQMTMKRYFDEDKNQWVDKAIMVADGKLLDPKGVVIIKKGAAPAE
jgi:HK97 family phage major capsid protein